MNIWKERSKEVANLFNPAFCCSVLTSAIIGYNDIKSEGMPFPIAFMILPIVLHKKTREALPNNTTTTLGNWIQMNNDLKIGFYDRLITMKPFTQEAILFGFKYGWINLNHENFCSEFQLSKVNSFLNHMDGDARECILKSRLLGRWLAKNGSESTIMYLWGIRP